MKYFNKRNLIRLCGGIMFISGVIIMFSVILPIAEYVAESKRAYPNLLSPVADDDQGAMDLLKTQDLTKASNWFVGKDDGFEREKVKYYRITIPKLGIENATVSIGGEDLSDSLIQYPGTAEPGRVGNTVIFGHSILPIFYDPGNYLAIFSTLNKLDSGDKVIIQSDEITYQYEVYDKFEVRPEDVEVMNQDSDGKYISLITCTPPGHPSKPKRLVVRAKIVPIGLKNNESTIN